MPSKLLIAAADAAHAARHAGVYGVKARVSADTAQVMKAVRRGRDGFVGSVMEEYRELLKKKLLLRERAVFTGPRTLRAGKYSVEFKAAVIATGSVAVVSEPYRACPGFLLGLDRLAGPLTGPVLREEAIKLFSEEFNFCPHHSLIGLYLSFGVRYT